ncbi:uncharacterized protein LOC127091468 [Lathyrus oleraceus]|uniref:uncharacterized protein LOC127091468 n=1 Tax=Pisum sativum TaxID=3888 RepID=UPI0021CE17A0|nr:uncharacterized protein LOC127091468 [Pisum sativum]
MTIVSNDRIPTNLLILDSKNYDKWAKQMRVLFGYQEVGDCESAKQAWEILEKAYVGAFKAKVVRLQTYKRQFKLTQMEDKETINDYITRITRLVNQIKSCGEMILEQNVVSKVLRSLTPRFDNIVVAIEESKDLTTLSKDESQSSLDAHEQRMDERGADKAKAEIVLQARFNEKNKRSKGKFAGESSSKDSGHSNGFKKRDVSKVQCYKCRKFGHFANSCRGKLNENHNNEAKVAREEVDDEDTILVMITEESYGITDVPGSSYSSDSLRDSSCTVPENSEKMHSDRNALVTVRDGVQGRDEWYLDSGCSTHMTGRKDCIGQLLERGYKIRLEDKILRILDSNGVLILKAPMTVNRTFKVELKVMEHRCLATAASRD